MCPTKSLGKDISQLIMSVDEGGTDVTFLNMVFNKVMVNLYMFITIMLHRVICNVNYGFVVTVETHESCY